MKACIIQPPYYADYGRSDECFDWEMKALDGCDSTLDLIVLPESCDIPSYAATQAQRVASVERYNAALLAKAADTARRCGAVLFINARSRWDDCLRNTTYAFDKNGNMAGTYFKQHTTPGEMRSPELDNSYTLEPSTPEIVEIDGVRYAFLTCYDFYFYEAFSAIARCRPDVIIGCSHQRTDTHAALETMCRFLAYNTNAYVVRASVSMGEDSPVGGGSMIVAPDGGVLCNMLSHVGSACAEFDPHHKYVKSAGFGGRQTSHWEYVEEGRRPWKYRPAGGGIIPPDRWLAYPRVCAHRGFNSIAPENSLPAFGAAVALGADEIEFDVWRTRDGHFVSTHDSTLERTSNGHGKVYDHTLAELEELDFGSNYGPEFSGLRILRLEELLRCFACRAIMNIHVKTDGFDTPCDGEALSELCALIRRYDCDKHAYIMCGNDNVHAYLQRSEPDISRCMGAGQRPFDIVERAVEYGCARVQLFKGKFEPAMVEKAHSKGLICNVFWADDPQEAQQFADMGIDTILTNDYNRVAQVIKRRPAYRR